MEESHLCILLLLCCGIISGACSSCFGNSCYVISRTGKKWDDNRKSCQRQGGDLLSIETLREWKYINSEIQNMTLSGANEWHIGLKKVGNWTWVNGISLNFDKWQRYQPSEDGDVAVMSKDHPPGSQGLFNDLDPRIPRAYICEKSQSEARCLYTQKDPHCDARGILPVLLKCRYPGKWFTVKSVSKQNADGHWRKTTAAKSTAETLCKASRVEKPGRAGAQCRVSGTLPGISSTDVIKVEFYCWEVDPDFLGGFGKRSAEFQNI